jgi:hypothetical protein
VEEGNIAEGGLAEKGLVDGALFFSCSLLASLDADVVVVSAYWNGEVNSMNSTHAHHRLEGDSTGWHFFFRQLLSKSISLFASYVWFLLPLSVAMGHLFLQQLAFRVPSTIGLVAGFAFSLLPIFIPLASYFLVASLLLEGLFLKVRFSLWMKALVSLVVGYLALFGVGLATFLLDPEPGVWSWDRSLFLSPVSLWVIAFSLFFFLMDQWLQGERQWMRNLRVIVFYFLPILLYVILSGYWILGVIPSLS